MSNLPTSDGAFAPDRQACPYSKPFPRDFDECPAFTPVEFRGTDLRGRGLRPVQSCAHLGVGRREGEPGAHFGICRLGGPEERAAWARTR